MPWSTLTAAIQAAIIPSQGKLWAMGCESIRYSELEQLKQDLAPVWSAYGILVDPVNLESIDHTGRIIVIDRKGELRAGFPPTVPAATVLGDVKKLL